jgi:DNA-binding transcriptional regulator GbsR (MarR family)
MKQFIEDAGIVYEEMGLPRMAGRIFGWLLVCEPPHQSAEELADTIEASKGSISSMTRLLIQMGLVERMGLPGRRGTYYRIKPGSWSELMRTRMWHLTAIRELAERGLDLTTGKDPKSRERLQELRDFHAFLELELPALFDRYDHQRKRQAQETLA